MRTYDLSGDPAAVEAQQIEQRMRLAQLLAAKGMSDGPVYSNRAGLAKMLTGVLGNVQMRGAEKEQRALAERQQAAKRSEMDAILAATQGDAGYLPQGAPQVDDEGNAMPGAPKGPDRMKLAALLARSSNPNLQQAGLALAMKGPPEEESFSLKPGEKRFRGSRVVAEVPVEAKPEDPKKGAVRERIQGDQMLQEDWDGQQWAQIGGGGRWNPKAGTTVNVNGPKESFKNEKTLRDEFMEASKPYVKVRDAFTAVKTSLSGPISAPATLAGATKFMKMLDPDSVVRESELQMALKSTGMLDRFLNLHNVVMKGGVLTPSQASEIQRIAGTLYQASEGQQKRVGAYYTKLATDYQLDPARVVRDLSPAGAPDGLTPSEAEELAALRKRFGQQ